MQNDFEEAHLEIEDVITHGQGTETLRGFSGEVEEAQVATLDVLVKSLIARSFGMAFENDLVKPYLKARFVHVAKPNPEDELPHVEFVQDAMDPVRMGVTIYAQLPELGSEAALDLIMDIFNTLTVELLVAKLRITGDLVEVDGVETYKGIDTSNLPLEQLPFMRDVMLELSGISERFLTEVSNIQR